jgi:chorismate mutase/prephenate dehydratase
MNHSERGRPELRQLREQIDKLDDTILRLLNERMLLVEKIASLKHQAGQEPLDLGREQAIFRRLAQENKGPLHWGAVKKIFGEILAASRDMQASRTTEQRDRGA